MSRVEESVEVEAPAALAYTYWRSPDKLCRFLEGVEEVREIDERTLEWRGRIGGRRREWRTQVAADEPGRLLAWVTTDGPSDVTVRFAATNGSTRVEVVDLVKPQTFVERVADLLGLSRRRVRKELRSFKELVEADRLR